MLENGGVADPGDIPQDPPADDDRIAGNPSDIRGGEDDQVADGSNNDGSDSTSDAPSADGDMGALAEAHCVARYDMTRQSAEDGALEADMQARGWLPIINLREGQLWDGNIGKAAGFSSSKTSDALTDVPLNSIVEVDVEEWDWFKPSSSSEADAQAFLASYLEMIGFIRTARPDLTIIGYQIPHSLMTNESKYRTWMFREILSKLDAGAPVFYPGFGAPMGPEDIAFKQGVIDAFEAQYGNLGVPLWRLASPTYDTTGDKVMAEVPDEFKDDYASIWAQGDAIIFFSNIGTPARSWIDLNTEQEHSAAIRRWLDFIDAEACAANNWEGSPGDEEPVDDGGGIAGDPAGTYGNPTYVKQIADGGDRGDHGDPVSKEDTADPVIVTEAPPLADDDGATENQPTKWDALADDGDDEPLGDPTDGRFLLDTVHDASPYISSLLGELGYTHVPTFIEGWYFDREADVLDMTKFERDVHDISKGGVPPDYDDWVMIDIEVWAPFYEDDEQAANDRRDDYLTAIATTREFLPDAKVMIWGFPRSQYSNVPQQVKDIIASADAFCPSGFVVGEDLTEGNWAVLERRMEAAASIKAELGGNIKAIPFVWKRRNGVWDGDYKVQSLLTEYEFRRQVEIALHLDMDGIAVYSNDLASMDPTDYRILPDVETVGDIDVSDQWSLNIIHEMALAAGGVAAPDDNEDAAPGDDDRVQIADASPVEEGADIPAEPEAPEASTDENDALNDVHAAHAGGGGSTELFGVIVEPSEQIESLAQSLGYQSMAFLTEGYFFDREADQLSLERLYDLIYNIVPPDYDGWALLDIEVWDPLYSDDAAIAEARRDDYLACIAAMRELVPDAKICIWGLPRRRYDDVPEVVKQIVEICDANAPSGFYNGEDMTESELQVIQNRVEASVRIRDERNPSGKVFPFVGKRRMGLFDDEGRRLLTLLDEQQFLDTVEVCLTPGPDAVGFWNSDATKIHWPMAVMPDLEDQADIDESNAWALNLLYAAVLENGGVADPGDIPQDPPDDDDRIAGNPAGSDESTDDRAPGSVIIVVDTDTPEEPNPRRRRRQEESTTSANDLEGAAQTASAEAVSVESLLSSSNARSPVAVIRTLDTDGMAPFTVHVNALGSRIGAGDRLSSSYEWDFGDSEGAYNTLRGWNAAHTYDKPGIYTITLGVKNEAGLVDQKTVNITVEPDTRRRIYVSALGNDANNGRSENQPVRTLNRAVQLLRNSTTVLLRRGETFDIASGAAVNRTNWSLSAYGAGDRPVLRWTGGLGFASMVKINSNKSRDVMIENIHFDSQYADNDVRNIVDAIKLNGTNVTVRDCSFGHVTIALNAAMQPTGVLSMNNAATTPGGLRAYYLWAEGTDHTHVGNVVSGSTHEHNIRLGGADRVLLAHNTLTNDDKRTIWAMRGSHAYISSNTLSVGRLTVGPNHAEGEASDRFRWCVLENNVIDKPSSATPAVEIEHGAERVLARNNIIKTDGGTSISIDGFDAEMNRTTADIRLFNNTAINAGDGGRFLEVGADAKGIAVANNLYVAPELETGNYQNAIIFVLDDDLSSFVAIANNVWPVPADFEWVGDGYHYVWPYWSNADGYRNIEEWEDLSQTMNDFYENVELDVNYRPEAGGAADDAGARIPGVFEDLHGADRPTNGKWTVGAVEVP